MVVATPATVDDPADDPVDAISCTEVALAVLVEVDVPVASAVASSTPVAVDEPAAEPTTSAKPKAWLDTVA